MTGVYKIENIKTGKLYIGSSISVKRRQYYHFNRLRNNKHPNRHLQNSFNHHGEEYFQFSIIEECTELDVIAREQFWIDSMWDSGLYNVAKVAGASFTGRKHKNSTIDKMKDWQTTNGNSMTGKKHRKSSIEQMRKTCSDKFGYRRKLTPDEIQEISILHKTGIGTGKLAVQFGVSKHTIQRILSGKRYKLIPRS
jgi:group I intron endonuclease